MCWSDIEELSRGKYTKDDLSKTGVYIFRNIVNKKMYIGSAAKLNNKKSDSGFYGRWRKHINLLKTSSHYNTYLQNAWNKYEKENFIFEIAEFCEPEHCIERENFYFNKVDFNQTYNLCPVAGNTLGIIRSQCTKDKVAKSLSKSFSVVSPEGLKIEGKNIKEFSRDNNLSDSMLSRVISGKIFHHRGWTKDYKTHQEYLTFKRLRGLNFVSLKNRYRLEAQINQKSIHLGYYKSLEIAEFARDLAEVIWDFEYKIKTRRSKY